MIIRRLTLNPFAGVAHRSIELEPGLTVILGPNESGKSTLFRALTHVLLTTVDLTPSAFDREIGACLPNGGGDTIRVAMEFSHDGKPHLIERTWVRGNRKGSSRLKAEDGAEYTLPSEIDREMRRLLPASPASVREILLTGQSALADSHDTVQSDESIREELGAVLRRAIMDAGGISVDRLKLLLESRYTALFDNWDSERNAPSGGRGIDNPHRRRVGTILQSYYAVAEVERQLEIARTVEHELDSLNASIRELQSAIDQSSKEHERLAPLRDTVRAREVLESERRAVQAELSELQKTARDWPVAEERIRALAAEHERALQAAAELAQALDGARTAEKLRALRERVRGLNELKTKIETREAEAAAVPADLSDQQELRMLDRTIDTAHVTLQAATLTVLLRARNDTNITFSDPTGAHESVSLEAGAQVERRVEGVATFDLPDVEVTVTAGSGEMASAAHRLAEAKAARGDLLAKIGVSSAQELEALVSDKSRKQAELALLRKQYAEMLGEDSYETLVDEAEHSGGAATSENEGRTIEQLAVEHSKAERAAQDAVQQSEQLSAQMTEWQKRYGSFNSLLVEVGKKAHRLEEIDATIESAPPLPAEFASADQYFARIDHLDNELQEQKERLSLLIQERSRTEARLPDESSEELDVRRAQARGQLDHNLTAGKAIAHVRSRALEILNRADADTFGRYQERFLHFLSDLTAGRYMDAKMKETTPHSFVTPDGTDMPLVLLSAGTRDSVALALRLVMAEYLLGEKNGFLVLDDPLVDMDPERRKLAGRTLKVFSEQYQTILFTCHPDHAEMLAEAAAEESASRGALIELSR